MDETTAILVDLFVIFAAARVAGELFTRLRQPAIVGEVLAGVLIGPHALGLLGSPDGALIDLFGGDREAAEDALNVVYDVIATLGVIILLFFVGLETKLEDLIQVRNRAVVAGVLGTALPFVAGFAFIWATGRSDIESAFVATAMVATSVGITARVLSDLGVIASQEARIIIGAAVVDDIIGLLMLAVVNSWGQDDLNVVELSLTGAAAIAFVAFAALIGTRAIRRYSIHLDRLHITNGPFVVAMLLMLGLSALAGEIGLAAIIGAFLAGMMLAEAEEAFELERQARGVYDFLVPFFFVIIGTKVDLSAFKDAEIVAIAVAVTALAIATKFVAGVIAARGLTPRSSTVVGAGMVPRGEVGFVVASVGAGIGAVSGDMFAVVVFMSVANDTRGATSAGVALPGWGACGRERFWRFRRVGCPVSRARRVGIHTGRARKMGDRQGNDSAKKVGRK